MALGITQLKNGVTVVIDGEACVVVSAQHVKPGKGGAFARVKLRNLKTQAILERTFKGDERIQDAFIEQKKLMFLYNQGGMYNFMDQEHYEEVMLSAERLAEKKNFLKDNLEVTALFYKHHILNIELPTFVVLKVVETEPGIRGDTAKQAMKPAKLETGLKIDVPLFVNIGNSIKVDTRTSKYMERA